MSFDIPFSMLGFFTRSIAKIRKSSIWVRNSMGESGYAWRTNDRRHIAREYIVTNN